MLTFIVYPSIDGDTVELSNLNRQVLYSKDDIGESKVGAAKQRLNQINPNVDVEPYDEFVSRDEDRIAELLLDVDMIVLAWASLGYYRKNTVEELVHLRSEQQKIPLIELGGDPIDITVGPIYAYNSDQSLNYGAQAAKQTDNYYSANNKIKSFQVSRMKQDFLNGDRVVNAWQSAPSLSAMSGLAVDQVVKALTGYDEPFLVGRRFHMSMVNFETRVEQVIDALSESV